MKNTNKGFSLIELMVVVAIIGILATIAIPNFQRFQARSRQSSAKTELSGIFTAQKSFFAEYQTYHAHLAAAGFVPEGVDATYNASALATSNRVYGSTSAAASTTAGAFNDPVTLTSLGVTTDAAGLAWLGVYLPEATKCGITSANIVAAIAGAPDVVQNGFTSVARGCPRRTTTTTAEHDHWTMTQDRILTNTQSGI